MRRTAVSRVVALQTGAIHGLVPYAAEVASELIVGAGAGHLAAEAVGGAVDTGSVVGVER